MHHLMSDRYNNVWFGSALAITAFGAGYIAAQFHQLKRKYAIAMLQSSDKVTIESIIRPNILTLSPYRCARDDYNQGADGNDASLATQLHAFTFVGILLDANENSLGPPLTSADIELLNEHLERYPCPYQMELKQAISDFRCWFIVFVP